VFKLSVESPDANGIKILLNAEGYRAVVEELLRLAEEGTRIDPEEIITICKNNGVNVG